MVSEKREESIESVNFTVPETISTPRTPAYERIKLALECGWKELNVRVSDLQFVSISFIRDMSVEHRILEDSCKRLCDCVAREVSF